MSCKKLINECPVFFHTSYVKTNQWATSFLRVPVVSHPGRFTPTVVWSFHTQCFFQISFFVVQISS